MKINIILTLLSSLAFIFYGYQCFSSVQMKSEFNRFGLSYQLRYLTGVLEILGGLGLIVGFYIPLILMLASGGLALLMSACVYLRIKIKDGMKEIFPAFFLLLFNIWIFLNIFFDLLLFQK